MTPLAQKLGAGFSWLLAAVTWVDGAQKHITLLAGALALILTIFLIWNAILENCKRRREEREAHRREIQEIEEAACRARRSDGRCPRCDWKPSTFSVEDHQ
jgi:hypothetical protein